MEDRIYILNLFDVYGELLNERQKAIMRLRLLYDYSLSEIGEELNVSRQAVHDAEKKSVEFLKRCEDILSIAKKQAKFKEIISIVGEKISSADIKESEKTFLSDKLRELEEEIC